MSTRMRTISESIAEVRAADPQTALTETALRRIVKTGKVPTVKVGRKFLVNLDKLTEYLSCGENFNEPQSATQPAKILPAGGIRRIKEKFTIKGGI